MTAVLTSTTSRPEAEPGKENILCIQLTITLLATGTGTGIDSGTVPAIGPATATGPSVCYHFCYSYW